MLAKRIKKRRAQQGKVRIPAKPDKPCDASEHAATRFLRRRPL